MHIVDIAAKHRHIRYACVIWIYANSIMSGCREIIFFL